MTRRILLVDDEPNLRRVTAIALGDENTEVVEVAGGTQALELLRDQLFDCVVSDLKMPSMDGLQLLAHVKETHSDLPFVLMTAHASVDTAVAALKQGAYDYLTKPIAKQDLRRLVDRAIEHGRLLNENRRLRHEVEDRHRPIGQSETWLSVVRTIERVAHSDATILLTGASGTGKEVLARYIHAQSDRHSGPFVAVNCAALPENLLESELFGHTKGAFTGADQARQGRFQRANGGTLLLDEVGDLPLELQAKLLRALQEREVDPIGANHPIRIDVRVVAATNADLQERVDKGSFRADLYYRLAVLPIRIPPLAERPGDPAVLFGHFLTEFAGEHVSMTDEAAHWINTHQWQGNVRELRNVAERCWLLGITTQLLATDLTRAIQLGERHPSFESGPGQDAREVSVLDPDHMILPDDGLSLEKLERAVVVAALKKFDGNKSAAARYLDIPRHVLIYRLEKYQIDDD